MTPVLMDHFDENPDDVVLIVCVFSGVPACRTSKKKVSRKSGELGARLHSPTKGTSSAMWHIPF